MFLHRNVYEHNMSTCNHLGVDEHIVNTTKTTPCQKDVILVHEPETKNLSCISTTVECDPVFQLMSDYQ